MFICWGLSPRVRGNRYHAQRGWLQNGSIPACAGEPLSNLDPDETERVYPRVCGGTDIALMARAAYSGLSPRVRGNRIVAIVARGGSGSIPACAGEPCSRTCGDRTSRVYPRVCGGTISSLVWRVPEWGLSPRVRGNPDVVDAAVAPVGSIPACAGEPACGPSPDAS